MALPWSGQRMALCVWQQRELAIPLWVGPVAAAKQRSLAALQRARRVCLETHCPEWAGLRTWDPHLANEQLKGMPPKDQALLRVIQSGQLVTAVRAHKLALVEEET